MRILGFKPLRFRQWLDVVDEEQRVVPWRDKLDMLWHILLAGTHLGTVSCKDWRLKMRRCPKCPVFDRTMKRCRPYTGHEWGCGCYVPFLALSEKECFADKYLKEMNVGWNAKRN